MDQFCGASKRGFVLALLSSVLLSNVSQAQSQESPQVACGRALIAIQDTCRSGGGVTAYYGIINTLIKNRCEVKENRAQVSLNMSCRIAGTSDVLNDPSARLEICRRALAGCERHFATRPEVCRRQIGSSIEDSDKNFFAVGSSSELQNCAGLLTLASSKAKVYVDGRRAEATESAPTGEEGNYICILDFPGIKYSQPVYFKSAAEAKAAKGNFFSGFACKADPIRQKGEVLGVKGTPTQDAEDRTFNKGKD